MKITPPIFIVTILSINHLSYGQAGQETKPDSSNTNSVIVDLPSHTTSRSVYTTFENIWLSNKRISYLSIPKFYYLEKIAIPFREGEGKDGFIFEGSNYHEATIILGKKCINHLWRTSRFTFDFGFNIRMVGDTSKPLIPNNLIIGLSYEKILWDSYTKLKPFSRSSSYSYTDWISLNQALAFISLNLTAHHFSNGQAPGFYYRDTINGISLQRNDYLKGDFSTNYIQIGLTYTQMFPTRSIFTFKLGYQLDGNVSEALGFSTEQLRSYGQRRLFGYVQYRQEWRRPNRKKGNIPDNFDSSNLTGALNQDRCYELVFRFNYDYILDDLSLYPYSKKYRFNPRFFILFTRPEWKALGFVIQCNYGRDYSNIRYDLPVFGMSAGFSINFSKYKAPFYDL